MQGVLFAFTFLARVSFYSDPKYLPTCPNTFEIHSRLCSRWYLLLHALSADSDTLESRQHIARREPLREEYRVCIVTWRIENIQRYTVAIE